MDTKTATGAAVFTTSGVVALHGTYGVLEYLCWALLILVIIYIVQAAGGKDLWTWLWKETEKETSCQTKKNDESNSTTSKPQTGKDTNSQP